MSSGVWPEFSCRYFREIATASNSATTLSGDRLEVVGIHWFFIKSTCPCKIFIEVDIFRGNPFCVDEQVSIDMCQDVVIRTAIDVCDMISALFLF